MNIDVIIGAFNRHGVDYLLIGGVNFLLRHRPLLTFDVDFWIHDSRANRRRTEAALADLGAEWGPAEAEWKPVTRLSADWLGRQTVFCLTSPHGAIDVFRKVKGLPAWRVCHARALSGATAGGVSYLGIGDEDMLRAERAIDKGKQRRDRVVALESALKRAHRERPEAH